MNSVWSREFPNEIINIYGLVSLKSFYLPWAMLALDLIFGNPLKPDILGMVAGHSYYLLTVLHPLAGGNFKFNTPLFVYPFLLSICNSHNDYIKLLSFFCGQQKKSWVVKYLRRIKLNLHSFFKVTFWTMHKFDWFDTYFFNTKTVVTFSFFTITFLLLTHS